MLSRPYIQRAIVQRNALPLMSLPMRGLKLHEYQAGALLHKHGVQIPVGNVAFTADEAHAVASKISGGCVIKS